MASLVAACGASPPPIAAPRPARCVASFVEDGTARIEWLGSDDAMPNGTAITTDTLSCRYTASPAAPGSRTLTIDCGAAGSITRTARVSESIDPELHEWIDLDLGASVARLCCGRCAEIQISGL